MEPHAELGTLADESGRGCQDSARKRG